MAADDRYCLGCDYGLKGLPENRCPECGREFDPENPATFEHTSTGANITRFLSKPPGWPINIAAILATILGVEGNLYPGGVSSVQACINLAWVGISMIFVFRLAMFVSVRWSHQNKRSLSTTRLRWLIAPGCLLLCVGLIITEAPARVFFLVNKPALNRFAQQVTTLSPATRLPDQQIGSYPATSIETFPGGFRFLVKGAGLMHKCGFAYSTQGPPPGGEYDRYYPLNDHWYLWESGV